jgi:uncharacterized RDD family membrane protein YckC
MNAPNPYSPPRANVDLPEPESAELEPADRGTRLGANLLDGLISGVPAIGVIWGVLTLLGYSLFSAGAGEPSELLLSILSFGVAGGFYLAINGYLLARHGQSVGKRLCSLRILRQDGSLPTLWESFGKRHLSILLLGQVPIAGNLVSLVDALFIFRGDRRCLHDLLAGTQVVKVPRRPAVAQPETSVARPEAAVKTLEVKASAPLELCPYCAEPTSEFTNVCRGCGRNPFVVDSQAAHRALSAEELLRKAERLYGHGLGEEALAVHVQATRYHSNRREAWQGLLAAPNAEPAQQEEARQHLARLQRILAGV